MINSVSRLVLGTFLCWGSAGLGYPGGFPIRNKDARLSGCCFLAPLAEPHLGRMTRLGSIQIDSQIDLYAAIPKAGFDLLV